jgi:signal peptidase II
MSGPTSSGLAQAILSTILLVGMLVLYLRRFASSRRWVAVALGICVLDQAAKALLPVTLGLGPFRLLGGYLTLSYLENRDQGFGGSFSYLLLITAICALALIFLYGRLSRARYRMSALAELGCALMIGGYLGLLLDRIRLGFVVDFLEFGRGSEFVYNVADLAVLLALAVLAARALQFVSERKGRQVSLQDRVVR